MADFTSSVEIIFGVVDNASKQITGLTQSTEQFAQNLQSATQPLADLTGGLLKFTAGVGAAGAALVTFSLTQAVRTESAFVDLAKVSEETIEQLQENFGSDFRKISAQYGVSLTEVIQSTADFKQAGFDTAEAIALLDTSLKAAVITELNAAQASQLLVQTIKGFGLEADEAASKLDVLNAISNAAAVQAGTLGKSIAVLAPFVQGLGFSFEDTAAFLTPVLEEFQDGTRSARGLQIAFANLATQGTKAVREEFARLGVVTKDSNGELLSGKEILNNLRPAFDKLTESQKVQTAEIIAGSSQVGRFLSLMRGLGVETDTTTRQAEIYALTLKSGGSAQREFETFAKSTEIALKQLSAALGIVFSTIGEDLLPGFKALATSAVEFVNGLQSALDAGSFDTLLDPLNQGFADLAEVVSGVAEILPQVLASLNFTPILDAFGGITGSLTGLFDGLDLTDAEDLERFLQNIINAFANVIEASGGVIDTFVDIFKEITPLIESFSELDSTTLNSAGNFLAFGTAVNTAAGFAGAGAAAFGGLVTGIASLPAAASNAKAGIAAVTTALTAANVAALGFVGAAGAVGFGLGVLAKEGIDALVNGLTEGEESLGTWIAEITGAGEATGKFGKALNAVEIDALKKGLRDGSISVEEFAKQTGLSVEAGRRLAGVVEDAKEEVRDYDAEIRKAVEATKEKNLADTQQERILSNVRQALESTGKAYEVVDGALKKAAESQEEFGDEFAESLELYRKVGESVQDYAKRLREAGISNRDLGDDVAGLNEAEQKSLSLKKELVDGVVEYSGNQLKAAEATKKVTEEVEKELSAADKLKIKLEEIASNERLKAIELKVGLDIKQLEADTERLDAVLESVNTSITSTGDVISSALGALGEVSGFYGLEQLELIERQLEIENKNREQALELQRKLTEAQIENIEAKTKSLERGDALIKIEGDGLEPELEAFMFQILKKIQLRASAEGAEFLLGIGV